MGAARLPGPRGLAQLDPLRRIFADPQPVLDELRATYGPVIGLGAGPARMAIVGDATLIREVFATSTDHFRWGHKFNVLGFVTGATSIIVSDGADHQRRRSAVQAAFTRRRLDGWVPGIVEQTDRVIDDVVAGLDGGTDVVDLYPVGRRLVQDVVARVLFGPGMVAQAPEIGRLFERPQAYLESPAVRQIPHRLPHTRRAAVRGDRLAMDAIIDAEIAAIRRAAPTTIHTGGEDSGGRDSGGGDSGGRRRVAVDDVLAELVTAGDLSDAEIRDQVVTLIGAGFDTTAASLAWMIWCAALHPTAWQRLRAEADAVLGAPGGAPDATSLRRLTFAAAVLHETLRLHPAGAVSPREAVVDLPLGGHTVRAGTLILWSAHLAGRDPSVWDDPLRWDPDRLDGVDDTRRAVLDGAWVPFGGGARNCIGFALAQMELTLMIARLAQRLDVVAPASETPRPVGMVVNRPSGGASMRVTARTA